MDRIIELFINTMSLFYDAFASICGAVLPHEVLTFLSFNGFNIYLFSDTGWFEEPITISYIIALVMFFWLFFFLLRLLWKGTKKFINMVFGVFRV